MPATEILKSGRGLFRSRALTLAILAVLLILVGGWGAAWLSISRPLSGHADWTLAGLRQSQNVALEVWMLPGQKLDLEYRLAGEHPYTAMTFGPAGVGKLFYAVVDAGTIVRNEGDVAASAEVPVKIRSNEPGHLTYQARCFSRHALVIEQAGSLRWNGSIEVAWKRN